MLITKLTTPIVTSSPFGTMTITHTCFLFEVESPRGVVTTHRVFGALDAKGNFVHAPDYPSESAIISGADLLLLLAGNSQGKKQGAFRTDDVIEMHNIILARQHDNTQNK